MNQSKLSWFTSAGLEEFEINGDLQMNQDLTATKEFNYTYLARSAFQENSKTIPLSYFDTESGQYVAVNIDFPAIEVAGTAIASSYQSKNSNKTVEVTTEDENIKVQSEIGIVSPRFDFTLIYSNWIKQLNILLTGILAMILLMLGIGLVNFNKHEEAYQKFWNDIQKNGINYSNLFQILNMLKKTPEQDIYQAIEMSSLGKKEKNYFLLLLKKCEEFQFKTGKSYAERANKSYFKQLFKAIKNENNS